MCRRRRKQVSPMRPTAGSPCSGPPECRSRWWTSCTRRSRRRWTIRRCAAGSRSKAPSRCRPGRRSCRSSSQPRLPSGRRRSRRPESSRCSAAKVRAASRMTIRDRVLIAGAGPVGMVAAANLVRRGVPVTVLEANAALSDEPRASTFHPPTLDMLHGLGAAEPLIAQGLKAPQFQYRTKRDGLIGQLDFAAIADATAHPFRLQCEQSRLTRILLQHLRGNGNFEIMFSSPVRGVKQTADGVEVAVMRSGMETETARWLIGADGARSETRSALDIEFEGFTWPERFLVVSTAFDFQAVIKGLVSVNYVADPQRWHFLLQIPGLWRIMFPIAAKESDELALSSAFAQSLMAQLVPGIDRYEIV